MHTNTQLKAYRKQNIMPRLILLILLSILNCSSPELLPRQSVKETTKPASVTNSFTDIVILKNGQTIENVKATYVTDSLVVTDATGKTNIFSKNEVLQIKQEASTNPITEAKIDSHPELKVSWSDYQGNLKWNDANAKCKSIGMRLPTIPELKAAYNADLTKTWKEAGFFSGTYYWSSTSNRNDIYYFFDIRFGGSFDGIRNEYNFNEDAVRNDYHFVRCVR
jgi:hypothetical protein